MQLIRGTHNLLPHHRGCVVTIGNFDGVHCGHRAVLSGLQERAKALQMPTCVMTFEPLPLEYFAGDKAPARLMGFREKYRQLQALGIDRLFVMPFNSKLANSSAQRFIREILVDGLGVRHIVVGDDFRFGHQRCGDFALLQTQGKAYHFSVEPTGTYRQGAQRISSTRIRQTLSQGRLALAAKLLGRPFSIEGRVIHGDKRGRTIGYPTANVHLYRQHTPLQGVFAIEAVSADGQHHQGMASLGTRPTIENSQRTLLEVNLFDFCADIYGQRLRVIFRHYLRGIVKYTSLETLTRAIAADEVAAREFFAGTYR